MPFAPLPSMVQPITINRRGGATDAEGRPTGAGSQVASVRGVVIELAATELPEAGTLGQQTTAQAIIPLGTDAAEQDTLTVTYGSGMVRTYRIVAVHDAVRTLLVDLHRDVA